MFTVMQCIAELRRDDGAGTGFRECTRLERTRMLEWRMICIEW